jgi:hypothetical protein
MILPKQVIVPVHTIALDAENTAFAVQDTVAIALISAVPEYSTPPSAVTVHNPLTFPLPVLILTESAVTVAEDVIDPEPDNTLAPLAVTVANPVIAPAPNNSL